MCSKPDKQWLNRLPNRAGLVVYEAVELTQSLEPGPKHAKQRLFARCFVSKSEVG